ncbi:uncharacterized protein [Diadema setosum]|uniref:uncharacterized protein n=1 Tax=Diadema setosum TaxID=31175 RepID=UPI003B3A9DEA
MSNMHYDQIPRQRKSKWDTPALAMPSSTPYTVAQADGQVSSLEAASAAAARINAMLISKGKLKLPPTPSTSTDQNKQKQGQPLSKDDKAKSEPLVAEVEINEVPIQCRNMLTKGATQEEISRLTGAAVSTRGRYMSYADRATNNMGERPLYLCVQGPTPESVERAVEHIKTLIGESMQMKGRDRARSRFSAAGGTGALSTRPAGLGVGVPTAPGVDGALRNPTVGGSIRGPAVGGNPIVPPPAVQMAIQAAQTSGHYLQDKVFVGLEHADPSFNVREKVQGPGSTYLQHIRSETGANIYLRGRGSGCMEPTSGREAFENLYIYVTHPKPEGLQAAKKLCENLVATIQAEYITHQSQLFQRSAPAMVAAQMIAPLPPRPAQPMQPIQQQAPVAVLPQTPPTITSIAVSTSLSQTLAAQQQAQAILAGAVPARRPVVSTVVTSLAQGVAYPHLQVQAQPQLAVVSQPGMVVQARAPRPVPAPVPPPQVPMPVASQTQLYPAQATHVQAQQTLVRAQAQVQVAQAQVAQVQAQAQAQAQAQLVQARSQAQVQVHPQHQAGIPVGQQQVILHQQPAPVQAPPAAAPQPVKRRFREDLSDERPEHHPLPMTNLGVPPPGHIQVSVAGGASGGHGSLLGLPRPEPEDRRLMPPPPNPQSMQDGRRKLLHSPSGLDLLGVRSASPDEPRTKRGRLVSYEMGGDSDEDDDIAGRSRSRFDAVQRYQSASGSVMPRGLPPPNIPQQVSSAYSLSTSPPTSSYYKPERRDPGMGSSPFWMARN